MKVKKIEISDFFSENKEKIYMKRGDDIIEIRKKCRTKYLCFKKFEIHDILFDDKLVKNTFDYLKYPNLKTEINELDSGEHFILED